MLIYICVHVFFMPGVGFAVGGNSGINYLVLQVHYASVDSFRGKVINIDMEDIERVLHGGVKNLIFNWQKQLYFT